MRYSIIISLLMTYAISFSTPLFSQEPTREVSAPPITCDIRTQFMCIAAGNSQISLSESQSRRVWVVVDNDTGSMFKVEESKSCGDFVKYGSIFPVSSGMAIGKSRFLRDLYRIHESEKCTFNIIYQKPTGRKRSYSELLSNSQVLFCHGWQDSDCKQRFDLTLPKGSQ